MPAYVIAQLMITDPEGFAFENLRTEFGTISATIVPGDSNRCTVQLQGDASPPAGFELQLPTGRKHLDALPATVEIEFTARPASR